MLKIFALLFALAAMASAIPAYTPSSNAIPVTLVSIGNQLYLVPVNQQQAVVPARPAAASRQLRPAKTTVAAEPESPYAQFSYSYNVFDEETGDSKSVSQTRDGDKVSGSYSVLDPDGTIRTVTYTADAENGFRATVDRQQGPQFVPTPAPTTAAPMRRVRVLRRRKLRPTPKPDSSEAYYEQ